MARRNGNAAFEAYAVRPFPTVYKYLPKKWAKALVRRGGLRLGTLHDYQDEERHGLSIGDQDEGVKVTYDEPRRVVTGTGAPLSPPVQLTLGREPPAGIVFDRCRFEAAERSPNRWLYCTSTILDVDLMHAFSADCCVQINEPRSFFRAIFQALADLRLAREMDVVECVYRDRTQHYLVDDDLPPWALKDTKYSQQGEIRGVFLPWRLPIEPKVMRVPACAQHCTLLDASSIPTRASCR